MTFRRKAHAVAPALMLAALAGCGDNGREPPRVPLSACMRVDITDPAGRPVVGIEDLAIDHEAGRLYLSAYDRRAVARERDSRQGPRTTGGLYLLDIGQPPGPKAVARPLVSAAGTALPKRPHGIALYISTTTGRRQLFAIDRRYVETDGDWQRRPTLAVLALAADGNTVTGVANLRLPPELCSPNDLVPTLEGLLVTSDHGTCRGLERRLEDAFGLDAAFVARLTPAGMETAVRKLRFANGIALARRPDGEEELVIAATRADALFSFPPDVRDRTRREARQILRIDASPDNITTGPDGALYVAVHPRLFRYALFRGHWFGIEQAPSEVLRLSYDRDGTLVAEPFFNDPDGAVISGATVAAVDRGHLYLGAAYDDHLAVCTVPPPPAAP